MKIYRLERNGIGPFVDYVPRKLATNKKKSKRMNHTFAQVETPKHIMNIHMAAVQNRDHLFGTPSKELLKAYFGYNLAPFFKQGFKIHTYEVPDHEVKHMGIEVAFPVKYHKFKTIKKLEQKVLTLR